jgi:radical SAM superfamily enzyme YgiQ (UPF0313 family)
VVLGGVGFSIMPKEILSYTGADIGLWGDGEEAMLDLVLHGKRPGKASFLNLKYFSPNRGNIDNRFYFAFGGMAGIETSRGCNRNCIYCADPLAKGKKVRFRSPESVAKEAAELLTWA